MRPRGVSWSPLGVFLGSVTQENPAVVWGPFFCLLVREIAHPYEQIGFGEGRYAYENIGFSASFASFPMKT